MAVTRQNLIDRLNAMRAATAANPIKKSDFAQFLEDWLNYMTNDGQYSAGVLEQWKTETLALQNAKLNADITLANNAAAQALASAAAASLVAQGQATDRPSMRPALNINFMSRYIPKDFGFTRASTATYIDKYGNLAIAKQNEPRYTYDPTTLTLQGLLFENVSKKNYVVNSELVGYTIGAAVPTNNNGLRVDQGYGGSINPTVKSLQKIKGYNVITLNFNGTTTNQNAALLAIYTRTTDAVQIGKKHTFSCKLNSSGKSVRVTYVYQDASQVNVGSSTFFDVAATTSLQDLSFTTDPAPVGAVRIKIWLSIGSTVAGQNYNFDVEFAAPQFEEDLQTSYIPTPQTDTATRQADNFNFSSVFSRYFKTSKEGTIHVTAKKGKGKLGNIAKYISLSNLAGDEISVQDIAETTKVIASIVSSSTGQTLVQQQVEVGADFFSAVLAYKETDTAFAVAGTLFQQDNMVSIGDYTDFTLGSGICAVFQTLQFFTKRLPDVEILSLSSRNKLYGNKANQLPTIGDLGALAYMSVQDIINIPMRESFVLDGTGSSFTRNIRYPFDFKFEIIDSTGFSITTQPASQCLANTDNPLVVIGSLGKSLSYAITPVFEY